MYILLVDLGGTDASLKTARPGGMPACLSAPECLRHDRAPSRGRVDHRMARCLTELRRRRGGRRRTGASGMMSSDFADEKKMRRSRGVMSAIIFGRGSGLVSLLIMPQCYALHTMMSRRQSELILERLSDPERLGNASIPRDPKPPQTRACAPQGAASVSRGRDREGCSRREGGGRGRRR